MRYTNAERVCNIPNSTQPRAEDAPEEQRQRAGYVPAWPICPDSPPGSYCSVVLRPAQRPTWYLAVTGVSALALCGRDGRMGEDVGSSCARPAQDTLQRLWRGCAGGASCVGRGCSVAFRERELGRWGCWRCCRRWERCSTARLLERARQSWAAGRSHRQRVRGRRV
jgi:hypothetical protein